VAAVFNINKKTMIMTTVTTTAAATTSEIRLPLIHSVSLQSFWAVACDERKQLNSPPKIYRSGRAIG
jgi:hypothetical protein